MEAYRKQYGSPIDMLASDILRRIGAAASPAHRISASPNEALASAIALKVASRLASPATVLASRVGGMLASRMGGAASPAGLRTSQVASRIASRLAPRVASPGSPMHLTQIDAEQLASRIAGRLASAAEQWKGVENRSQEALASAIARRVASPVFAASPAALNTLASRVASAFGGASSGGRIAAEDLNATEASGKE